MSKWIDRALLALLTWEFDVLASFTDLDAVREVVRCGTLAVLAYGIASIAKNIIAPPAPTAPIPQD